MERFGRFSTTFWVAASDFDQICVCLGVGLERFERFWMHFGSCRLVEVATMPCERAVRSVLNCFGVHFGSCRSVVLAFRTCERAVQSDLVGFRGYFGSRRTTLRRAMHQKWQDIFSAEKPQNVDY